MSTSKSQLHSGYLNIIFDMDKYNDVINKTSKIIRKLYKQNKIDSLAFTGISGASVAYPVYYKTGIPIIHLRKEQETSHGQSVESGIKSMRYCIIDDLIAHGYTMQRIIRRLSPACCHCIILYNDDSRYNESLIFKYETQNIPIYLL